MSMANCALAGRETSGSPADMCMWLRGELHRIDERLRASINVIASRADEEIEHIMPGHPHLQRAQPIRWSHGMVSYGFRICQCLERPQEAIKRLSRSALGCGALPGKVFNIDHEMMAKELGRASSPRLAISRQFLTASKSLTVCTTHLDFRSFTSMLWGIKKSSNWHKARGTPTLRDAPTKSLAAAFLGGHGFDSNPRALGAWRGRGAVVGTSEPLGHRAIPLVGERHGPTLSLYALDKPKDIEQMGLYRQRAGQGGVPFEACWLPLLSSSRRCAGLLTYSIATGLRDYLVRKGVLCGESHYNSGHCVALSVHTGTPMNELVHKQLNGGDAGFGEDIKEVFDRNARCQGRCQQAEHA